MLCNCELFVCILLPTEVLQCFLATREAMQLQQNETVYESSGTSTLPSSTESPGTPDKEPPQRPWDHHSITDQGLSFTAACHLLVSRCLFLLLGVRAAWQEESVSSQTPTESSLARFVLCAITKHLHAWVWKNLKAKNLSHYTDLHPTVRLLDQRWSYSLLLREDSVRER